MGEEKDKSSLYQLVDGPDGRPIGVPIAREEEPDPVPAADGKYYLTHTRKGIDLAIQLASKGVEVYCARCKAPLKVSPYFVLCTKDERHFSVSMSRKP